MLSFGKAWLSMSLILAWTSKNLDAAGPSKQEELLRVEHEIKIKQQKAKTLSRQAEELHQKIEEIRKTLVDVAQISRQYEERISRTEKTLASLNHQEKHHTFLWHRNQNTWGRVLIMLYHLSRASPASLFLTQKNPHEVVQSMMVLKSAVPYVHHMLDRLKRELDDLKALRQAIADERMMLAQTTESLGRKQTDLQNLLKQKSSLESFHREQQDTLEKHIKELGFQAETLRDLLAELEAEEAVGVYKKTRRSSSHKLLPSTAFRLLPPVHGPIVLGFNHKGPGNEQGLGVVYETRSGAQVLSPASGQVVFAGPFRTYKHIVIIDHGKGFHTLFAGMNTIVTPVGQEVLPGEPIGMMPPSPQRKTKLYMELRQDGEPIDPSSWWSHKP